MVNKCRLAEQVDLPRLANWPDRIELIVETGYGSRASGHRD